MKDLQCVVIGGGYAGINAIQALLKAAGQTESGRKLRLTLIDRQPHHLRKVLLFKPAAGERTEIRIPFAELFPSGVRFVQGTVSAVDAAGRELVYEDAAGNERKLDYDILIVAVGSIVKRPDAEQGGIALTDLEAAERIRHAWRGNMRQAVREQDAKERARLLTAAVAGAGISGIEASAELAVAMRQEAKELGLDPEAVQVWLLNAQERLFPEGPDKVGRRLEKGLREVGVQVKHRSKAVKEAGGRLLLSDGAALEAGVTVWTLGLAPHPALRRLGLPLSPEGRLPVDESYRVREVSGIYGIGDCALIVDPANGLADRMTCKEAGAQAARLAKVILADLDGKPAPVHKRYTDAYCFSLGPDRGMVWTRQWGLDMIIGGKLGWKIRKYTWDLASLIR